jgi:hypothetical protein
VAKKQQLPEPLDPTIVHPEPDTSANKGSRGVPPATWNPGKVNRPAEEPQDE